MVSITKQQLFACILLLLTLGSSLAQAELSASVNSTQIIEGDAITFTLTLRNESAKGDPNFSILTRDFTILSNKQSRNVSIVNGSRTGQTQWLISLLPKGGSNAVIPAITLNQQQTKPIAISIKPAPKNQTVPSVNSVLISSEVDRSTVYVGGQILLKVSIIHRGNLAGASLSDPIGEHLTVEQVHETSFKRVINNTAVIVIERTYALFPEQAGALTTEGQLLQAQLNTGGQRGLFGLSNTQTVHRKTPAIAITVLPLSDFAQSKDAITANDFQLEQAWSGNLDNLSVGDSITRTLSMTATGASSAQIPPISNTDIDGIKQYRDQPILEDQRNQSGLTGLRKESVAYVLTQAGSFEIPSLTLHWVDASTGKLRSRALPSTQIKVAPASNQQATDITPINPSANENLSRTTTVTLTTLPVFYLQPWFWVSCVMTLLWLFTLILLIKKHPTEPKKTATKKPTDEAKLFKQLISACKNNDAQQVLTCFTAWGQAFNSALYTNEKIYAYLGNAVISKAIQRAEKSLYQAEINTSWSGTQLSQHLIETRKKLRNDANENALAPLYS